MQLVQLLLDLTSSELDPASMESFLVGLMQPDMLGASIDSATVLLPGSVETSGIATKRNWRLVNSPHPLLEANFAFQHAADAGSHLLLLLDSINATNEILGAMLKAFDLDPHFGVSIPRLNEAQTGDFLKLSEEVGDTEIKSLPRRVMAEVADIYVLPDVLSNCFVIRDVVITNLASLDESFETVNGTLREYLSRCRRAGYRTVCINRAAIPGVSSKARQPPVISKTDRTKLQKQHPDIGRAKTEFMDHPAHQFEGFLGRLFSRQKCLQRSLLLDLSGIPDYTNGTVEAVLALCDGMKHCTPHWQISVRAIEAAVSHHRLRDRLSSFQIHTEESSMYYTAAIRPSQPWRMNTMVELHRIALLNVYTMLDTIAWDILFEAPYGLTACWEFMCQYADAVLYNSDYTRKHMTNRFPIAKLAQSYVFGHSLHPRDYNSDPRPSGPGTQDYIFVIGNSYEHKHLRPTVDLLSSAFPLEHFRVLGIDDHIAPNVETLPSGRIPAATLDKLFAEAKMIVFPSLYEGFGLPIVKGLSHHRTVLARESELLVEVASRYRGPGRLIKFGTPSDLVNALGRLLHDHPVLEMPLGSALKPDEQPRTWRDVAEGILAFIEERMSDPASLQWPARDRAVRQIEAFSAELPDGKPASLQKR